jgi:hypothetical protein
LSMLKIRISGLCLNIKSILFISISVVATLSPLCLREFKKFESILSSLSTTTANGLDVTSLIVYKTVPISKGLLSM